MNTQKISNTLPEGFEALEPFINQWGKPTQGERISAANDSSLEEEDTFYDAMLQHASASHELINRYGLLEMPDDVYTLALLMLSLCQVSIKIELRRRSPTYIIPPTLEFKVTHPIQPFG